MGVSGLRTRIKNTPVVSLQSMNEPEFASMEDALDRARTEEGADEEPQEVIAPEGFAVKDEATANWLVRKIAEMRLRRERMKATKKAADVEIKNAEKSEIYLLERFGPQLAEWVRPQIVARKKSIQLLEGGVGFRKKSAGLVVVDEEATLAWASEHCTDAHRAKVTYSLDKAALQRHFEKTGEVPPGCSFEPETEVLTIK